MNTQDIKTKFESKQFKKIIVVIFIVVITLIIFNLGMQMGYMKASFMNTAGDNFYTPGIPHRTPGFIQDATSGAHGANGKIISINLPTVVVADNDSTEKIINIEDETIIRKMRDTISASELQVGDFIVVIGEPNTSAQLDARFIRVTPSPIQPPKLTQ